MTDVNVEAAMVDKVCIICKTVFQELQNTGDWKCVQHPGTIIDGHFTCCNMSTIYSNTAEFYQHTIARSRMGCVRCDHRTTYAPFDSTNGVNYVPVWFAPTVRHKYHALELRTVNGEKKLYVHRFDSKRAADNTHKVTMHNLARRGLADDTYILKQQLSIK